MKGYSFETFRVNDENRSAFETCRAVAALAYSGPGPIILLGPHGAGKSHLLWAIVHEVRSSAAKAGLGLVMAHEFPEAVRGLVDNPAPIQSGKPAVLLVDETERFQENAADLEAVIQVFLDAGHSVVLASSVDPDRLPQFNAKFKDIVRRGCVIELRPPSAPLAEANEEEPGLRAALDAARAEIVRLEALLAEQSGAEPAVLEQERDGLAQRLAAAEAETESALEEQSRLQTLLRAKESVEAALKDTRAERDEALEALRHYEESAKSLFEQMESRRAALSETFKSLTEGIRTHARRWKPPGAAAKEKEAEREALETALEEARALAGAFREQMELERQQFETRLEEVRKERDHAEMLLEQAHAEQGRLKVALDSARGRLDALERELESARKTVAIQTAEMDALRHEAAAQVALATMQAGEMEGRAARLQSALDMAIQTAQDTESEVLRHRETLLQVTEALRRLSVRNAGVVPPLFPTGPAPAPDDRQAYLFDAVPDIESIESPRLEAFIQGFMPPANDLPGSGQPLRDAVDAALSEKPVPPPPPGAEIDE